MIQKNLSVYSAQNLVLIHADIHADEVLRESRIEKKNVEMNYRNYESKIVEKYGVTLDGWPSGIPQVCNPSMVRGRVLLERLLHSLESGQCQWVVLTDDELEARKKDKQAHFECGEEVYKPHRSTTRARRTEGVKSAEIIDDEDEDNDNNGSATGRDNGPVRSNGDSDDGGSDGGDNNMDDE
jgi:hypothetical protein